MRIQLFAAAFAATVAVPAYAADAVVEDVVVVDSAYNWSGVYVGAQAGYAWGSSDVTYAEPGEVINTSADPDGWLGGFYVGYNYQLPNNVVVGIDGDFAWSNADSDFEAFNPSTQASAEIDYSGAIRARLGYAVDRWLPYIAGGVAMARATYTYDMAIQDATIKDTLVGWTLGAGVEYAATDNLILRAEYRYTDFGDGSEFAFSDFPTDEAQYDLKTNDIRIGIAYKF